MKRIFYLLLNIFLFICITSCKDDNDNIDWSSQDYIIGVEVLNKESAGGILIDNFSRIIEIGLLKGQDKSDIELKLLLADGVKLINTDKATAFYNLKQAFNLKILINGLEIVYTIRTKDFEDERLEKYKGWYRTLEYGKLPDGVKIFRSPDSLQNKRSVAFIALIDLDEGRTMDVLGEATGVYTPTKFYENTGKKYSVIINGGYFWQGVNLSMLWRNGELVSKPNQVEYRKDTEGNDVLYYPTRAVFSWIKDKEFRADWVYTTVNPGTTYAYPEPAVNKSGSTPLEVPSATFPFGAWEYKAKTAIGAGPLLIKGGKYRNTWEAELFDDASGIGPKNNNPRTAIGITSDNKLLLFVCEGRNQTPNTPGFTLDEVTKILLDLDCVEAINLDGGGSSCMLVNGIETILPSDANNVQRPVVSAVGIR